jgi:hypothetical protein
MIVKREDELNLNIITNSLCQPHTKVKVDYSIIENNSYIDFFLSIFNRLRTPLYEYVIASIPHYLEQNICIGSTIYLYAVNYIMQKRGTFLFQDLDGGYSPIASTLSELSSGKIKCLVNTPHHLCNSDYENDNPDIVCYNGMFDDLTANYLCNCAKLKQFSSRFDIIWERLCFPMYSHDRYSQISLVSKNLKDDGLLIVDERLSLDPNNYEDYLSREIHKDRNFKTRFFSEDQVKNKLLFPMEIVNHNEVTINNMSSILACFYKHAVMVWNSANNYTIIASNCRKNIEAFLKVLPDFNSNNKYNHFERLPYVLFGMTNPKLIMGGLLQRQVDETLH